MSEPKVFKACGGGEEVGVSSMLQFMHEKLLDDALTMAVLQKQIQCRTVGVRKVTQ
jgi:hypothetical protein